MRFVSLRAVLTAVALVVAGSSCVQPHTSTLDVVDVTVRPRVVLDGTVELSDRTDGRVVVDRILAHAGEATVAAPLGLPGTASELLETDADDALLFRYLSTSTSDDAEAAERVWTMPVDGARVRMSFSPASEMALSDAPFEAAELLDHTVVVQGSIALLVDGKGHGFSSESDPDGTPAIPSVGGDLTMDGDPDGTPADGVGESDPDGTPAEGVGESDPDGTPAEGLGESDPDGTPAKPAGESDPDGTPARPTPTESDPDGTPARSSGDPDGTPAWDPSGEWASRSMTFDKLIGATSKTATMTGATAGRVQVRVPFTIYIDGAFDYDLQLDADALAAVGADEVLPIDLRFPAAALISGERLELLERLATDALAEGNEDGAALAVSASTAAPVMRVEAHRAVTRDVDRRQISSSRIEVTGPVRR